MEGASLGGSRDSLLIRPSIIFSAISIPTAAHVHSALLTLHTSSRCLQRLEWNRAKESEADEARVERERERMAMLLIDWHDFSVVRTIDFDDSEDVTLLGPPVTKQNVIQMNRGADAEDEGAVPGPQPGFPQESQCSACLLCSRHAAPHYN